MQQLRLREQWREELLAYAQRGCAERRKAAADLKRLDLEIADLLRRGAHV
jgi:hypothetical protein